MPEAAGVYLNRLSASWPLFRLLYRKATDVLPPPEGAGTCRELLTCSLAMRTLAKDLGVSPSTVGEDLRRLVGYRWVQREGRQRKLGTRRGRAIFLLADIVAEEATGKVGLVSLRVLGIDPDPPKLTAEAEAEDARPVGRGLARRYEP